MQSHRGNFEHEGHVRSLIKFIYSEKATSFCEISTVDLSNVVTVKSIVEILKIFVAFSDDMKFTQARILGRL